MSRPMIYSIGHSNHQIETFIALLKANQVACLVDVRSAPYSRYSPHFSKHSLEAHLRDEGVEYRYLGDRLGGRPEDESCYDEAGNVDYEQIAGRKWFTDGIQQLLRIAAENRTAMMCSEEDPSLCHRNLLITDVLLTDDLANVEHIRGDGARRPAELKPKQARLF